jgi:hypothetical protein
MRIAAWLLPAFAALPPAPASATAGLCEDLRLVIGSARDTPTFSSIVGYRPARVLALFRLCRANLQGFTSEATCIWRLPSTTPAVEGLAAEALLCLRGARRLANPAASARGEALLDFESLVITIGQDRIAPGSAGDGARVTVSIPEG